MATRWMEGRIPNAMSLLSAESTLVRFYQFILRNNFIINTESPVCTDDLRILSAKLLFLYLADKYYVVNYTRIRGI